MNFSPLAVFDRLVPKDRGSRRIARELSFGREARQRLDVYAPVRAPGSAAAQGPLPVLVFVYGGSWSEGERSHYRFVGRALAARGFVTVIADYRLVPAVAYPAFVTDVALALEWVHREIAGLGGDPERIVVAGHSAGAYNAVMAIAEPFLLSNAARRAIRGFAGLSGPYDFYPFEVPITISVFGAVGDPLATQPVERVSGDMPPTWLGHGTRDSLVLVRNTEALARALRASGVPVTERHYEGLGHPDTLLALSRPFRWRAPVLEDIVAFAHDVTRAAGKPARVPEREPVSASPDSPRG